MLTVRSSVAVVLISGLLSALFADRALCQELVLEPSEGQVEAAEAEVLPTPPVTDVETRNESLHPQGYCLAAGDTLAIVVHGVIGRFGEAPTYFPSSKQPDMLPATGYPIQVQEDGCLHLPQLGALDVTGSNVVQSQRLIDEAYLAAGITNKPHMVMLSLLRKRKVSVSLVHSSSLGGRIDEVKMDADRASLIHALAGLERNRVKG